MTYEMKPNIWAKLAETKAALKVALQAAEQRAEKYKAYFDQELERRDQERVRAERAEDTAALWKAAYKGAEARAEPSGGSIAPPEDGGGRAGGGIPVPPPSRLEDATGGKPFGECSREELLEACRWFWIARDQAREQRDRYEAALREIEAHDGIAPILTMKRIARAALNPSGDE